MKLTYALALLAAANLASAFNWQDAGNIRWAWGCDFPGNDLKDVKTKGDQCGATCESTAGCTHFTWTNFQGGTCWMKKGGTTEAQAKAKTDQEATCGYIKSSSSASTVTWQLLKQYNLGDINAVRNDWNIIRWGSGVVNAEWQEYTDSGDVLYTQNGNLFLRAVRKNGRYYSARLHSKTWYTPANHAGKRLRVEFTAKIPTYSGAWPALWMLGDMNTYGGWPRCGEIDVMEWVHQLGDTVVGSLHWKGPTDWSAHFSVSRSEMRTTFITYGVEYSNHAYDEYAQFYIIKQNGQRVNGPKLTSDKWIWDNFPPCNYQYSANANKCSYAAPFDNKMELIMNIAVGGDWGNCCGVQPSDYNVFDGGVTMEVSAVKVFYAPNY